MTNKYTNTQIREYLNRYFVGTFRKSQCDHFYCWQTRATMAISIVKKHFTESELKDIFNRATTIGVKEEFTRFKEFINQSKL